VNNISKQQIEKAATLLNGSRNVLIITHYNPDGDAIGSSLGLYHFLKLIGKEPKVIVPNNYPQFLQWMPGNKEIIIAGEDKEQAEKIIQSAEAIVFLDFNVLDRTQGLEEEIINRDVPKLLIDHHPNPGNFADVIISNTKVSSTSELLFEFIARYKGEEIINRDISECLYTGIMTDTGSFSYNSSNPDTYYVVSKLINKGIDKTRIYWMVYDNYSVERMRLLGYCLNKKMKVFKEYRTAYISIKESELKKFNYQTGDTEGFVNYPLSIKNIIFSVIFIERKDHIKISFRSKGEFYANRFAINHFNGGGHKNAAGGYSESNLDETLQKFESLLPQYQSKLNKGG